MSIEHKVPLIGQVTDNLCWFAAFQMVEAWYNSLLPNRPAALSSTQLAHLKKLNWGVQPGSVSAFAMLMGLTTKTATADPQGIEPLLKRYGPIWYPGANQGYTPVGTHHVVVIRGIRGSDLLINDPSPVNVGARRTIDAKKFFSQLTPLGGQFLVMLANSKPNSAAIFNELKVH